VATSGQRILTRGRIAGRFSLEKFNMTLECFCGRPIGTLVDSKRENPDVIPLKVLLPVGGLDPYPIRSSLDQPKSKSETASRSVEPFLQGLRSLQIDRPTYRATLSIATGRIYLVLRCGLKRYFHSPQGRYGPVLIFDLLGRRPAGDVGHKCRSGLPLLSVRPALTFPAS